MRRLSLNTNRSLSKASLTRRKEEFQKGIYHVVFGMSDERVLQIEEELNSFCAFADQLPPTIERVLKRANCMADASAIAARMTA